MEKNNELFQELKNRFTEDQKLSKNKEFEKLEKVYKENSEWLKEVIEKNGWPRKEKVSDYGELCAWLIAQHSPDINFQKDCLKILKSLPKTEERKQHIAYLGDRILIKESKKQSGILVYMHCMLCFTRSLLPDQLSVRNIFYLNYISIMYSQALM